MATLCHFPTFFSRELFLFHREQQRYNKPYWNFQQYPPQKRFNICACSLKKPRVRRKTKSNAELCSEIREFVSAVGLPEGHVPSMKELSQYGRSDLANIVRRRGYKLLRELLATKVAEENTGNDTNNSVSGIDNVKSIREDEAAEGQDEKVNNTIEDATSAEIALLDHNFDSQNPKLNSSSDQNSCEHIKCSSDLLMDKEASNASGSHSQKYDISEDNLSPELPIMESELPNSSIDSYIRSYNQSHSDVEFPGNLSHLENVFNDSDGQDDDLPNTNEEFILSTEVSVSETYPIGSEADPALNPDSHNVMTEESSANLSIEEESSQNSKFDDGKVNDKNSFCTEASAQEHYTSPNINQDSSSSDPICREIGYSSNSTLEEKVANFLKSGILDAVEDDVSLILDESAADRWKSESDTAEEPIEPYPASVLSGTNAATTVDDSAINSTQDEANARVNQISRDDRSLAEGPSSTNLDVNLDDQAVRKNNQAEINHLKFMLHQKEMELSRLKEQIEKEKAALSSLQIKAEAEISKAQRLISEKDAELNAAEESLTGLKEVEIQYSGYGETVELAGSFNGWHHHIKLDPEPPSSIADPFGSSKSKLWTTRLWLYPGTYEIKFIVDGQWMLDPQRECVTRGTICNNILKVER